MIKLQNSILSREPVPDFLIGLAPESLADLSWTDPALGVQDCAWLPEQDVSEALGAFERYGAETLELHEGTVMVTREVVQWTEEEVAAYVKSQVPQSVTPAQIRIALSQVGLRDSVETAIKAAPQITKDWYEFATEFIRTNPNVLSLAAALSVSDSDLDALWTLAFSIKE